MTEEEALLAAIAANPADDLPRLVLADWLDENAKTVGCVRCLGGKPRHSEADCEYCFGSGWVSDGRAERAEFIRVQCEVEKVRSLPHRGCLLEASGGRRACSCERCRLTDREKVLWTRMVEDKSAFGWCKVFGDDTLLHIDRPQVYDRRGRGSSDRTATAFVRRGFVAEVRAPLAVLWGGECQTCVCWATDGTPRATSEPFACSTCSGTGGTPGVLEKIVAEHPIESVGVTDHNPYFNGAGHSWFTPNRERMSSAVPADATLPEVLFFALANWLRLTDTGRPLSGKRFRSYATAEYANLALSAALLALARAGRD